MSYTVKNTTTTGDSYGVMIVVISPLKYDNVPELRKSKDWLARKQDSVSKVWRHVDPRTVVSIS